MRPRKRCVTARLSCGAPDVLADLFSTHLAVHVCRAIKNVGLDIRRIPGTALAHHPSGKAVYTPPEGQRFCVKSCANFKRSSPQR